ncbi:MAG: hydroxymethylglutaryl-CoA lyase [Bacteroidetes bacterium]|nr:hydroxymethylglutaryl-CoA lyase [Bacteroidota bacterium]MBU1717640.1 hydroxymethylglutaryl-CoA lyase [Bacteroidota bacterium]
MTKLNSEIRITESTRDAIQGLPQFIPTERKVEYLNALLKVGFDTLDAGSFVSPKAIPQMADTREVLQQLDRSGSATRIMVLAANSKGVNMAAEMNEVDDISFPFSVSAEFLKRNTNLSHTEAIRNIDAFLNICANAKKQLVVYLTMAFGNPYGEHWSVDSVVEQAALLYKMGVRIMPLSDITGEANESKITEVYRALTATFPDCRFGLHLHSDKATWKPKVTAAWNSGCREFDTVLGGLGGCPMTGKEMLGNLDTFDLLAFAIENKISVKLNTQTMKHVPLLYQG